MEIPSTYYINTFFHYYLQDLLNKICTQTHHLPHTPKSCIKIPPNYYTITFLHYHPQDIHQSKNIQTHQLCHPPWSCITIPSNNYILNKMYTQTHHLPHALCLAKRYQLCIMLLHSCIIMLKPYLTAYTPRPTTYPIPLDHA